MHIAIDLLLFLKNKRLKELIQKAASLLCSKIAQQACLIKALMGKKATILRVMEK